MLILCLLMAGTASADTLRLPKKLEIIYSEAFAGTGSVDTVVVEEGTKRIESRTFAKSSVDEIHLPSSIQYIADDAFVGCENLKIVVPQGSYAHEWAAFNDVDYTVSPPEGGMFKVGGVEIVVEEDRRFISTAVTEDKDCVLEMRVLTDDESGRVLESVQVQIAAPMQEETVREPISITLPTYYVLEAVLMDEQGNVLSERIRSAMHTASFAELQKRTIADYDQAKVLDFGFSGFAVLAEDVLVLNASAVNDGNSYSFKSNADIRTGDIIQLDVAGVDHVIKVGSISRNAAGSMTVSADPNITIDEMYDAIKIDGNMVGAAAAASNDAGASQVFSLDHSTQIGLFELSSHLEMTVNIKCYYDKWIFDDLQFQGTANTFGEITIFFGGDVDTFRDQNAPAFQIYNQVVILPGIHAPAFLNVQVPLNVVAKLGGSATFGFDNTYGFSAGGGNGFKAIKEEGSSHAELKADGNVELTTGPEISLTVALFGVVNARIGAQFGPRITGEIYNLPYGGSNEDKVHACNACLDIDLYAVADARAALHYKLGKKVSGTLVDAHITVYEKKLDDAFYSISNESERIYGGQRTGGQGECKNYKYRTRVSTVDIYGKPLEKIPVTVTGGKISGISAETPFMTYLCNGN